MAHEAVHGYKGFDHDMSCRDFQYEVGKTYEHKGGIGLCEAGFHFCRKMADVFNYYKGEDKRYAEVEAFRDVIDGDDKSVTNKIRIVRELKWADILETMYAQASLGPETSSFPADEIIRAREAGALDEMLPGWTEFPVTLANGERNILVVGRDKSHTYLITKYLMAKPFAMNNDWTNKGGWPACEMRKHVQDIYDMLPEDVRKVIIPMRIRQIVRDEVVECEDKAFLLSAVNLFGKNVWNPKEDCDDSQIDIFRDDEARMKKLPGASDTSWWWLRSATNNNGKDFNIVPSEGINSISRADYEGGVIVGFCIETRP